LRWWLMSGFGGNRILKKPPAEAGDKVGGRKDNECQASGQESGLSIKGVSWRPGQAANPREKPVEGCYRFCPTAVDYGLIAYRYGRPLRVAGARL
jgi:hypothetical protein